MKVETEKGGDGKSAADEQKLQKVFEERCKEGKLCRLHIEKHIQFSCRVLKGLGRSFVGLDASQTWIMYWTFNSMALLGSPVVLVDSDEEFVSSVPCIFEQRRKVVSTQKAYQAKTGGFGGGPFQLSHLAPTFSAVQSILLTKTFDLIDIPLLKRFLFSLKQLDGSFIMHDGGESDLRASYCAMVVAFITDIIDDDLISNVGAFIASCQTYEGGFGAVPGIYQSINLKTIMIKGNEAHGGYTFCGFAALILVGKADLIDLERLERWVIRRIAEQGGFAGRSNKLVDSCYCYWIYALVPLIKYCKQKLKQDENGFDVIDRPELIRYLLNFAQYENGGFCDRFPSSPDFYHTCYALSSLSMAVHDIQIDIQDIFIVKSKKLYDSVDIEPIHPLFGVPPHFVTEARDYFKNKKCIK